MEVVQDYTAVHDWFVLLSDPSQCGTGLIKLVQVL